MNAGLACPGNNALRLARSLLAGGALTFLHASAAEDESGALPAPVRQEDIQVLLQNSPFTRTLGVSDSIILTGVARIQGDLVATLLDTETHESHLVSAAANTRGWQLISVGGNEAQPQTLSAKIQIGGEQVITVRYQKPPAKPAARSSSSGGGSPGGGGPPLSSAQMQEARRAAENYREGFSSDGYPRQPPPEIVEKLSRLSVSQREEINRQMLGLRNRGLDMPERRRIYEDMVSRAAQGRR